MESRGPSTLAPMTARYGGVAIYMKAVVDCQKIDRVAETIAHLAQLCNAGSPNLVQDKPFLLIAACFYLDAAAKQHLTVVDDEFVMRQALDLQSVITEACQVRREGGLGWIHGWTGLDDAIHAIYIHHKPVRYSENLPTRTASPNPSGHANV